MTTSTPNPPQMSASQALLMELAAQATQENAQQQQVRVEKATAASTITRAQYAWCGMLLVFPSLLMLLIYNFVSAPPSVVPAAPEAALDFVVKEIEGYRGDYSKLPETLIDAGPFGEDEFTYTRVSAEHYTVVVRKQGKTLTFDSRTGGRP